MTSMTESALDDGSQVVMQFLAGVWVRELNYEPRDTCADSVGRDESRVMWAQAPDGTYVDVRCVAGEGFAVRGFAGRLSICDYDADARSFQATWARAVDTKPDSCPSGIDTGTCRFLRVGGSFVLFEEGDGYLEVWKRVESWASAGGTVVSAEMDGPGGATKIVISVQVDGESMVFTAERGAEGPGRVVLDICDGLEVLEGVASASAEDVAAAVRRVLRAASVVEDGDAEARVTAVKDAIAGCPAFVDALPDKVVGGLDRTASGLVASPSHLTALVLVPPRELWEQVNAIRRELEPHHVDIWPPHITLMYPFVPVVGWDAMLEPLADALDDVAPFTVTLDTFGTFNQGRRGKLTHLKPDTESEQAIRALHRTLHTSVFSELSGRFRQPHMTVGRGQREPQAPRLQDGWDPLVFEVGSVALLSRPVMGDALEFIAELPLGGSASKDEALAAGRASLAAHLGPRTLDAVLDTVASCESGPMPAFSGGMGDVIRSAVQQ